MIRYRWPRVLSPMVCLLAMGCTSLREIPRSEFAAKPERKDVRMVTRDGLTYEFDYISVSGDSLVGYRRRDVSGPADEYGSLVLPLADVTKLSARGVDWYRTGLIGGGVLAALVARGLAENRDSGDSGGGGGGGRPTTP